MVLDKLLDAAIEQGKKERLETASRAWLRERLEGQRNRAQQAWVKSQPRGQESEADAITRANQYREQRAHDTRVNSAKARKHADRKHTIELVISHKTNNDPDLGTWQRLLQMIQYLGNSGMSSEEEVETVGTTRGRRTVFVVKVCVWRHRDVGNYLQLINTTGDKINPVKKGRPRLDRDRYGDEGSSGAPRGLPKCLYSPEWIEEESEANPLFVEDLNVSEEAFELLAAASGMQV
ncbi:hypothetical protein B0H16DRAFT_1517007 [Mycena metata]|uniref:Uncharacterized protein n=1 Tax=Mycena metata TaxID=1033252 RepID=A0AAD7JQR6_9AGAR|nr:hypothetical protein B0H16DRAFT_1517007 [Mycena metata]